MTISWNNFSMQSNHSAKFCTPMLDLTLEYNEYKQVLVLCFELILPKTRLTITHCSFIFRGVNG